MTKGTYLENILHRRRERLAAEMARESLAEVRELAQRAAVPVRSLSEALRGGGGSAGGIKVVAEIKRASPSKGALTPDLNPAGLAGEYVAAGASAVSVLTEPDFFRGSALDLALVKGAVAVPVLRKDFLVDPYQVYQSRVMGADAVLLIVAALGEATGEMLALAGELGMDALVEVHTVSECEAALAAGAKIIGINNRNLRNFHVDLGVTEEVAPPASAGGGSGIVLVSESGIRTRADVERVAAAGAGAVLVGESLVTAKDPAAALRELLGLRGGC